MAEHDIDELIESGEYALGLDQKVRVQKGQRIAYQVVWAGVVQEDLSIPVKVRLGEPSQLRGQIVAGRLAPRRSAALRALMPRAPGKGQGDA